MWFRHQKELTAEFFKTNIIFFAFFLLLFAALFLGDGKQAAADTFFAGGMLSLWIVALYQKKKIRPIPAVAQLLWAAVFTAYAISTLFSDSIGYSISSIVRLSMGYLAYHLFYSLSSPKTLRVFAVGAVVFVGLAALVAAAYAIFPSLAGGLPLMNLLYGNYGHNHLADLLVFIAPLIIYWYRDSPSPKTIIVFVAFVAALGFTFARGAWILIAAFFLFESVRRGHIKASRSPTFLAASVLLFGLSAAFLLIAIVPAEQKQRLRWFGYGDLGRQILKTPPLNEGRLRYWSQAISAIKERPAFGSGPGTFYLQSKRLQNAPLSYSWFAHSFPLETIVELGILGALPLFFLLFHHGKEIVRGFGAGGSGQDARYGTPLAIGAGLTLVYSAYEFNMNFLVVWVLFWSTLGLLLGSVVKPDARPARSRSRTIFICLFVVGIYYSSCAVSLVFSKRAEAAFLIAPHDADRALGLLEHYEKYNKTATSAQIKLIFFFHKKDASVIVAAARISKGDTKDQLYKEVLDIDPMNTACRQEYVRFLYIDNRWASLSQELVRRGARGLSESWARPLYQTGLAAVREGRYNDALPFWSVAVLASPSWSHPSIELASLMVWTGDTGGAKSVLDICKKDKYANKHCEQALEQFNNGQLGPPGALARDIIQGDNDK
ncbi:O-antigen ligase family protein [Patescibacteria group bacterium]|nr:O-antigen ligase family protein [Patescibacteria group bacterium]